MKLRLDMLEQKWDCVINSLSVMRIVSLNSHFNQRSLVCHSLSNIVF